MKDKATPTEKLFYKDPYLKSTPARILGLHKTQKSFWYAFDKSIFYPGGGGQSPDEGFINSVKLSAIREENDIIWHELNEELTGDAHMEIYWPLRLRYMQQHSGQHLVSAVFYREYGINTVSVHLGKSDTLIEFDKEGISQDILQEAEDLINCKIRDHMPIKSCWVPKHQLARYDLRRDIKVESDPVRLIQIGDYDVTGCGGTHVYFTSEIGLIKIIGTEKIRKHTRIQFKIGKSAYQFFEQLVSATQKISNDLSSSYEDLESKISKLIDEHKDLRRKLNLTRKNWLRLQAQQLAMTEKYGFFNLKDLSREELIDLSLYWFESFQKPCFFICCEDNKYFFVVRLYPDRHKSAVDFIKTNGMHFNLKGGGSGEFVQGVIAQAVVEEHYLTEVKNAFEEYIFNK